MRDIINFIICWAHWLTRIDWCTSTMMIPTERHLTYLNCFDSTIKPSSTTNSSPRRSNGAPGWHFARVHHHINKHRNMQVWGVGFEHDYPLWTPPEVQEQQRAQGDRHSWDDTCVLVCHRSRIMQGQRGIQFTNTTIKGHGPKFLEMMHAINSLTSLSVTVYHQFHDEVDRCR